MLPNMVAAVEVKKNTTVCGFLIARCCQSVSQTSGGNRQMPEHAARHDDQA
jgi:hypothetical protein